MVNNGWVEKSQPFDFILFKELYKYNSLGIIEDPHPLQEPNREALWLTSHSGNQVLWIIVQGPKYWWLNDDS
jgi:hypothetical protein